jgi:hypothetical protein
MTIQNQRAARRSKRDREEERRKRDAYLQQGLGKKYATYRDELNMCYNQVTHQFAIRRPQRPELVLEALEKLLVSNALPGNQADLFIAADAFQECLLNFGLVVQHSDMELLLTHFDTSGTNRVNIDEFVDSIRESLFDNPPSASAVSTAGVRGVQTLNSSKYAY